MPEDSHCPKCGQERNSLAAYQKTVVWTTANARKHCADLIEATLSKAEQGVKWRRLAADLRGKPGDWDAVNRNDA